MKKKASSCEQEEKLASGMTKKLKRGSQLKEPFCLL
ncbi:hypothetical protein CTRC69_03835 [Chlamydia trachomatis RC-F/69]|nr:hypothetical protein CTLINITIAL_00470 [Chlamydia trachomatis L2/434/Bu(i)]AGJ65115.1 hypothetical protein CTLFINAL_00470 [Chlamydia trachomatis L2/434/Bu(f)]AGR94163.1 hypothetical protein CTRC69_03835 [Chlamydia trachomatis RC-F/69]AGR95088.1 hypothetical protein CTRC46_03815 [Chlamydia trachomatis RC-L2(s)/46]AGR96013.1 hypothetical protein CTRC852_03890 [Chlamydia trachomatis RC-F(s)/852]AGR96967.1 hypothetical protein CTRC943_03800 [Chlamydia trachomatis RC-J/943]AGR98808.1 hypothetica